MFAYKENLGSNFKVYCTMLFRSSKARKMLLLNSEKGILGQDSHWWLKLIYFKKPKERKL